MEKVPCVVIGAGVIGLAAARAISGAGVPTLVLEQHVHFGAENSSRHSEVIHAGIYYPTDSLKAKFCVEGKKLLMNYVKERAVPYNRCGKVIIAAEHNRIDLKALFDKGLANGVNDLRMLTKKDMLSLEPEVECDHAILSPNTTIFDSHSVLLNYVTDIENSGDSSVIYNCKVLDIKPTERYQSSSSSSSSSGCSRSRYEVTTSQGVIACDFLVNAGGLHAQYIASHISGYPSELIPVPYFAKGNYYKLQRSDSNAHLTSKPFQRLIYPLPSQGGLGIHATLDLNGGVRFGPNVEWIQSSHTGTDAFSKDGPPYLDFAVNVHQAAVFCSEIRKYYPAIQEEDLQPDYAGIRPKLCGRQGPSKATNTAAAAAAAASGVEGYVMKSAVDFLIHDQTVHGRRGLVQLYGIESPGMTSSMAIGAFVKDLLLLSDQ